jgi:P27 family predicted phage terminase small subunit
MAKKGHSGRKPKATNILKLQGTYRPGRHSATEIDLPSAIPEPPEHIKNNNVALREWDRVIALLAPTKCLTELDAQNLGAYCIEFQKYKKANEDIAKTDSLLVRSTKGTAMLHPLLKASDHALANMLRISSEFGFTILARRTLRIELKKKVSDPKARFFERHEA